MEDLFYEMLQNRARDIKNDIINFLLLFTEERNNEYLFDSKAIECQSGLRVSCFESRSILGFKIKKNAYGTRRLMVITAPYEDDFMDENGNIDKSKVEEADIDNFDYCCVLDILNAVHDAENTMED